MRPSLRIGGAGLVGVGVLLPATAAIAQNPMVRGEPLPPLQQQWMNDGARPAQQALGGTGATDPGQRPPGVAPQAPMERVNTWLPATTVRLQALDKVNAQTSALSIRVGGSATFGSLTINARACVVRPADQPADAAAYLSVIDSHPDSPGFDGWMLEAEPSVSMMQHPVYDLRVVGCT